MKSDDKILWCSQRGYSQLYAEYWIAHPTCEVCEASGVGGMIADPPHHLKTRGSGGTDEAANLLSLCVQHHRVMHNVGDHQVGRMVGGEIQKKIVTAKKLLTA